MSQANGHTSIELSRPTIHSTSIEPQSMGDLRVMAKSAAGSKFFGAKTEDECLMVMLVGKDLGFSYTQSLRAFDIIQGKPALKADGMVAVSLARPDLCEYFRPVHQSATSCTWEAKRVGSPAVTQTFTIEEAKAAGLVEKNGDMYRKWPVRMLSARVKSFIARDIFPELLLGLLSSEELLDIAAERRAKGPEVKHVTYDATTGEVDDGADHTIAAAAGLEVMIRSAETLLELRTAALAITNALKAGEITKEQRDALAAIGTERKAQLTPVPEVVPAREPGEEG